MGEPTSGELRVRWASSEAERAQARAVRHRVFVIGQGVPPALEVDAHEAGCRHVLATLGDLPVGAARCRTTERGIKLERVAVDAAARGRGVGAALVAHLTGSLPGDAVVYLHAQESALGFWERLGFEVEGEPFEEAGIRHRRMRLPRG